MSDDCSQYRLCMHHGAHNTRISHLEKGMNSLDMRIEKMDSRVDDLSVQHARTTAKITGAVGVALALLQVLLKMLP